MINFARYLRKHSLATPPRFFFSEVTDPNKGSVIDKIIDKYQIDELAAYKDIPPTEIDYKRMRLPTNATVRQIYISYINHQKLFNNPDVVDKEVRFIPVLLFSVFNLGIIYIE
jgi:hypothetical protein